MLVRKTVLFLTVTLFCIVSCSKDDNNAESIPSKEFLIKGDWSLVSVIEESTITAGGVDNRRVTYLEKAKSSQVDLEITISIDPKTIKSIGFYDLNFNYENFETQETGVFTEKKIPFFNIDDAGTEWKFLGDNSITFSEFVNTTNQPFLLKIQEVGSKKLILEYEDFINLPVFAISDFPRNKLTIRTFEFVKK